MKSLDKLRSATSLSDLAHLLGYQPKNLSFILYKIPNNIKYYEFTIDKKNGNKRKISAPIPHLKKLQKRLAECLNNCFEEIYGKKKRSLSHGFRCGHSIVTNAKSHVNRRYVFNGFCSVLCG